MEERNLLTKLKEVLDELDNLEKFYRGIYNSAVDIEDFEISQKTQSDSYLKIRKLKEWKSTVNDLNKDASSSDILEIISASNVNDEESNLSESASDVEQEPPEYQSEEQMKVGEHVRTKMHELSNSGFMFNHSNIEIMKQKHWSKTVLGLDYAFIKIYDENYTITEQIKDELRYNRYWKEILKFGKYKVLITSQWFERHRDNFDKWYCKLDRINDTFNQNLENDEKIGTCQTDECTSKDPICINLFNAVYPIKNWSDALIKVCEIMLLKKPYSMARLDRENSLNNDQHTNFSYTESEIKFNQKRLSNGLWIETNRKASDIEDVIKKVLELCGYSKNDLTIEFESKE